MPIKPLVIKIYEGSKEVQSLSISYFVGQDYTVRLETPDGTDWKYVGKIKEQEPEIADLNQLAERLSGGS